MGVDRRQAVFGTGQVGSALAAHLAGLDIAVRAVSRHRPPALADGIDWRAADVTDPETAMAPPWAAISWKSYLPELYAGRRPADFGEYRGQVIASIRQPGHAKAFSRTTRTSHNPAEARLADVTAPALIVMGEQDPDFPDPGPKLTGSPAPCAEKSSWCPRPGTTRSRSGPTSPPARFCASWNRSRAVPRGGHVQASRSEEARWITGQVAVPQSRK
jgi:hypothetical protein